jgi:hypothetical protein
MIDCKREPSLKTAPAVALNVLAHALRTTLGATFRT